MNHKDGLWDGLIGLVNYRADVAENKRGVDK